MSEGWVKLWRKSIDSGLIRNHKVWVFWTYCLLKSNHEKDYKQIIGFQEIILQPGQFVFGRLKASDETGLSEQNIRTCLTFLKKCKNLTIKTTNKFSIITIINWDTYQNEDQLTNPQSNQQVTNNQPTSNQRVTTNKNLRTKEPKKKEIPPTPKQKKAVMDFKDYLQEKIIENNFIASKDKIFEFYEYRMNMPKKKQYQSEKGINGLFRDLNGCRDAGLIITDCLEIAMEKPWMTPDPKYYGNKGPMQNNNGQQTEVDTGEQWLQMRRDRKNAGK